MSSIKGNKIDRFYRLSWSFSESFMKAVISNITKIEATIKRLKPIKLRVFEMLSIYLSSLHNRSPHCTGFYLMWFNYRLGVVGCPFDDATQDFTD